MTRHDTIRRLVAAVEAQAPAVSVSVGTFGASASVSVQYDPAASPAQRAAAQAAVDAFDWSDAATTAWLDAQQPERTGLRADAAAALQANADYLALASPSNAQVAAQVRRLTQQMQRVIRRLVQLD